MPLSPGSKLGNYEIVAPLGAGGMGEVYRARDGRLGRDVALKIIPEIFASEPDRVARFEREARALAALQHPNIASLFGFEEAGTRRYLIMELVEGEDLSQRIARGALPVDEALETARQIAEGLEAAHEKGIVHRDLKPANIKITPDGRVKILDFGLARAYLGDTTESSAPPETMNSPTMTAGMTRQGMILGTAAYMSPEQARGKPADRRADLWAFGVILFEMLTGKRLFDGETISDILAGVLKNSPDWTLLPSDTPLSTRRLLERCLAKDPRRRLRSAGDSLLDLDATEPPVAAGQAASMPAPAASPWRERAAWILAAALAVSLAAILLISGKTSAPPVARSAYLEVGLPPGQRVSVFTPPTLSPDGKWIVYGTSDTGQESIFSGSETRSQLWLRALGSFVAEALPETRGAQLPFWSPDGGSIAYFQDGYLRRMDLESRQATNLYEAADMESGPRGGAWLRDGTILFAPSPNSGIFRINANGGKAEEITHVDPKMPDGSHRYPVALPDGEHFLFLIWSNNNEALAATGGIYLGSLKGEPPRKVLADASSVVLLPSGYLLLRRSEQLTAVPFDLISFTPETGKKPISVDTQEMFDTNSGLVPASASQTGDIAYTTGLATVPTTPVWLDLQGHESAIPAPESRYSSPALSSDRKRYALVRNEGTRQSQIWIGDLERGTLVPLTRGVNDSYDPIWSPDGSRIAFVNRDTGSEDIYLQSVVTTSPRELLFQSKLHDTQLCGWSEDGRYLLFVYGLQTGASRYEIWTYDFKEGKARATLSENFLLREPSLSPDGRWLAYTSGESGRPQIYVQSFPQLDRKWLISPEAGSAPHWRKDGKEIWYDEPRAGGTRAMSVSIQESGGAIVAGSPKPVLTFSDRIAQAIPDPEHTRWLALRQSAEEIPSTLRVILDWRPDSKR